MPRSIRIAILTTLHLSLSGTWGVRYAYDPVTPSLVDILGFYLFIRSINMEERAQKFRTKTVALNQQYKNWVCHEVEEKPDKLLSAGCADYLRHSAKLRLQYDDIFVDDDDSENSRMRKGQSKPNFLVLAPVVQTKIIHFIRHGEGFHNVGISNLDSKLTIKGWAQAHALGRHVQRRVHRVQLVVSSPLFRALETAVGAFGCKTGSDVLMNSQNNVENTQVQHDTVYSIPGVRYIVDESCRERLGPSNCDARRNKSELQAHFTGFDFSGVAEESDQFWKERNIESEASVAGRGVSFLQFIMSQPESNIAVVSHSAFLWFMLAMFGGDYSKPVREKMQKWFENGEMRSMVLTDCGNVHHGVDPSFQFHESLVDAESSIHVEPQQELIGNRVD